LYYIVEHLACILLNFRSFSSAAIWPRECCFAPWRTVGTQREQTDFT